MPRFVQGVLYYSFTLPCQVGLGYCGISANLLRSIRMLCTMQTGDCIGQTSDSPRLSPWLSRENSYPTLYCSSTSGLCPQNGNPGDTLSPHSTLLHMLDQPTRTTTDQLPRPSSCTSFMVYGLSPAQRPESCSVRCDSGGCRCMPYDWRIHGVRSILDKRLFNSTGLTNY